MDRLQKQAQSPVDDSADRRVRKEMGFKTTNRFARLVRVQRAGSAYSWSRIRPARDELAERGRSLAMWPLAGDDGQGAAGDGQYETFKTERPVP